VNNLAKNKKVAVGLSGGVDSSVSAYLLKEQGYDVIGIYMQCWDYPEEGCASNEDKMYAVQTAAKLGIKIETLNFIKEYKERVISYFYDEYRKGRTPNPDVMCNKEIKFGLFYEWALKQGFDYVATGHYARIEEDNGVYRLMRGIDSSKDQSYFLYRLNQEQLSKILFPVGNMLKKDVRATAARIELPTATRPDSTGICFVGEVNIREFLEEQITPKEGNVVLKDGTIIGTHEGVWFYTIGQRRGFTITKYQGTPLYVIGKNIDKNELIVGVEEDTYVSRFYVDALHWIVSPVDKEFTCGVRIRHLGEIYVGSLRLPEVYLSKPAFGVAPGQSAVFYEGDAVLGGGIIQ